MLALFGLNGVVVAVLTLLKEGGCCYFFVGVVVGVDFRDIPTTEKNALVILHKRLICYIKYFFVHHWIEGSCLHSLIREMRFLDTIGKDQVHRKVC